MLSKQAVLHSVEKLPDSASWTEIVDALLQLATQEGSISDFAKLYRTQITAEDLAEYANPKCDISLSEVIQELETRHLNGGKL